MKTEVILTKRAEKDLKSLPKAIKESLSLWVHYLETIGLSETKRIKGYNDEALKGDRKGQRSARLNKAYRVIYVVSRNRELEIVQVEELNKHKY